MSRHAKEFNNYDYKIHRAEDGNTETFYVVEVFVPKIFKWVWAKTGDGQYTDELGFAKRFNVRDEAVVFAIAFINLLKQLDKRTTVRLISEE